MLRSAEPTSLEARPPSQTEPSSFQLEIIDAPLRSSQSGPRFQELIGPNGEHLPQVGEVGNFSLSDGRTLSTAKLSYCVFGSNPDNPIIIAHPALTGSSRAMLLSPDQPKTQGDGWWSHIIGPDRALDTNKYTILCFDHFGGHYGATSANDLRHANCGDSLTLGDGVELIARFIKEQGVDSVNGVIGGSMGGGQALEWLFQDHVSVPRIYDISGSTVLTHRSREFFNIQADVLDPLKTPPARTSLQSRFLTHVADLFEMRSPVLNHLILELERDLGRLIQDYSDTKALAWCRKFGFLRFVTPDFFEGKYERRMAETDNSAPSSDHALRQVSKWLNHQGEQFVERFSASGLRNLCRMAGETSPRGAEEVAKRLSTCNTRLLGFFVHGDVLFPAEEQARYYNEIEDSSPGTTSMMLVQDLRNGHDHFLTPAFCDNAKALFAIP